MPAAVAPSTVENTCTHVVADAQNTQKIALCRGLPNEQVCQQDGCMWNKPAFVPEAPSIAPNTCTHKETQSDVETQVKLCKNPKDQQTCQ
jgi:hypothetical protein